MMKSNSNSQAPSFLTKTGLSAYSFACGYIQYVTLDKVRIYLSHEGACYHVRAINDAEGTDRWESFDSLSHSRTVFDRMCKQHFAEQFAWLRRDPRYTVTREWCGEREQWWIARFCGEWISKAHTPQQAKLICFKHNQERMP